jgi:hypothetical protein
VKNLPSSKRPPTADYRLLVGPESPAPTDGLVFTDY